MKLLSIDPGSKPGYVHLDNHGRVQRLATQEPAWVEEEWDVAVVESQWWHPGAAASPTSLFKLAMTAGWQLRGALRAERYMVLPPKVWRGSNANKKQLQRQCAKTLSAAERALFKEIPTSAHGDVLDAIMIGRAALKLLGTTQYDWPPVKQPRTTRTPKAPQGHQGHQGEAHDPRKR